MQRNLCPTFALSRIVRRSHPNFFDSRFFFLDFFFGITEIFRNSHVVANKYLPAVRPWTAIHARGLRLASRLRSVFFLMRLKIVDGVLMGSDKSASHKIFFIYYNINYNFKPNVSFTARDGSSHCRTQVPPRCLAPMAHEHPSGRWYGARLISRVITTTLAGEPACHMTPIPSLALSKPLCSGSLAVRVALPLSRAK